MSIIGFQIFNHTSATERKSSSFSFNYLLFFNHKKPFLCLTLCLPESLKIKRLKYLFSKKKKKKYTFSYLKLCAPFYNFESKYSFIFNIYISSFFFCSFFQWFYYDHLIYNYLLYICCTFIYAVGVRPFVLLMISATEKCLFLLRGLQASIRTISPN